MANGSPLVGPNILRLQAERLLEKLKRSPEISIHERRVNVHYSPPGGYGKRRSRETRRNKRITLPPAATGCLKDSKVRRRSITCTCRADPVASRVADASLLSTYGFLTRGGYETRRSRSCG